LPASACALTLLRLAHLAHGRGDRERPKTLVPAARREYEKALTVARREGDRAAIARALLSLAEVTQEVDVDAAWSLCGEARQLCEELREPDGLARVLESMSRIASARGDPRSAWALLEECLALRREMGDSELLIHALGGLGHLARDAGDYGRARALYQES